HRPRPLAARAHLRGGGRARVRVSAHAGRTGPRDRWARRRRQGRAVKVVPLAADSLGVRSMATYVECGQTRILIDPGASLGERRFNFPPTDEEWDALKRANERIDSYALRAGLVFVSHYHEDHFRYDRSIYGNRGVWAKDPHRMIGPRQAGRAATL